MFRATYEPQNIFTSPQHEFLNTKGKKFSSTVPSKYIAVTHFHYCLKYVRPITSIGEIFREYFIAALKPNTC